MIPSDEVVGLLQRFIRNACVNDGTPDGGHEERSVKTLLEYFGPEENYVEGVTTEIVEPHPGRQSIVIRIPGAVAGAPALMLLPHLDVVPVNPDGWSCDPFGAEIRDGFVWGRGAIDMLNVTSAMSAVFRRYLTGELPRLPGDLVLGAVADEEAGGELGARWLVDNRPELVACDYLLTEVATPALSHEPGAGIPVTVAEKGPHRQRFETKGTPGHGSQPYAAHNALLPLAQAISRLVEAPTPVVISPEWRDFVAGSGLPAPMIARLTDPDQVDAAIDELQDIDLGLARWAHACTHLTISPTVLNSGSKYNVIPDRGVAELDVRIVPGQDSTTVDDHFRKVLGPDLYEDIEITPEGALVSNASPTEGPLWEAIADSAEELVGSRQLLPMLIPVVTDARFFRMRGAVAYGVGLFDDKMRFGDMLRLFHGHDERVSLDSVARTTAMLEMTVARFARRTSEGAY